MDTSKAAAAMGRAGRGASKVRGDSDFYRAIRAKRRMAQTYEHRGEWGGYTVREGLKGWIVDQWSAIQGERTGWRGLLPYYHAPRDRRLDQPINAIGTLLAELVRELTRTRDIDGVRVLRRGHIVR